MRTWGEAKSFIIYTLFAWSASEIKCDCPSIESGSVVTVGDMVNNLKQFNDDFSSDGSFGNEEKGLSPEKFYDAAGDEVEKLKESNLVEPAAITRTKQLITIRQAQTRDGVFTPQGSSGENPTEVAQAKALVSEVRSWVAALQDLENPAHIFLDEAETLSSALDSNSGAVLEVYAMALESATYAILGQDDDAPAVLTMLETSTTDSISASIEEKASFPTVVEVTHEDGQVIGSIKITKNDSPLQYVISGSDLHGVALNTTLSMNVDPLAETIAAGDVVVNVNGKASNQNVSIDISDAKFTTTLTEEWDTSDNDGPVLGAAALKGALAVTSLSSGKATNKKITADAEIKFVALNSKVDSFVDNDTGLSLEKVALDNLTVSNDRGETAGLSASLSINNAAHFDTLSYLEGWYDYDDAVQPVVNVDFSKAEDGMETADSFLDATLNITGSINLEGKDEATLTITTNKTGIKSGNMTATLGYSGKTLQLSANTTNGSEDGTDFSVSFKNSDGATMKLSRSKGQMTGEVMVGSTRVGTINSQDGVAVIRYNDGTFESL